MGFGNNNSGNMKPRVYFQADWKTPTASNQNVVAGIYLTTVLEKESDGSFKLDANKKRVPFIGSKDQREAALANKSVEYAEFCMVDYIDGKLTKLDVGSYTHERRIIKTVSIELTDESTFETLGYVTVITLRLSITESRMNFLNKFMAIQKDWDLTKQPFVKISNYSYTPDNNKGRRNTLTVRVENSKDTLAPLFTKENNFTYNGIVMPQLKWSEDAEAYVKKTSEVVFDFVQEQFKAMNEKIQAGKAQNQEKPTVSEHAMQPTPQKNADVVFESHEDDDLPF